MPWRALADERVGEARWQLLILIAFVCGTGIDALGHLRAGNGMTAMIDGGIFLFCLCGAIPLFVKFVRGWRQRHRRTRATASAADAPRSAMGQQTDIVVAGRHRAPGSD